MELEIYRPGGIDPLQSSDAQIVDHVVLLATQQHPDDSIVFVTDDDGLPTVLLVDEKKRRGLEHVSVRTAAQVKGELPGYGLPAASIEHIGINERPPTTLDGGIDLFVSFTIAEFRGGNALVVAHFRPPGHDERRVLDKIEVPTVLYKQDRHKLFLPFSKLGAAPRRQGTHHVKLTVTIQDADVKKILTRDDRCLDFAMGSCYLTKH
jgi:hypothetical protein